MTRRQHQDAFSDKLHEFLRKHVGPLTVAEVVGIMQVHQTRMIFDCELERMEREDDDQDGEGWKQG